MFNSSAFNYINVLDKAADAANTRNEILSNNIANVDTPNYKRKDVSFQGGDCLSADGKAFTVKAIKRPRHKGQGHTGGFTASDCAVANQPVIAAKRRAVMPPGKSSQLFL